VAAEDDALIVRVYALTLKLPDADGCPARIIAVEED
jgi:kynurenine formamidase